MKKTIRISVLAGLLAVLMLLSGCGNADRLAYDKEKNGYVRQGDGAIYYKASSNYRAVKIDKAEEVGSIKQTDAEDLPLYTICNYEETSRLDSSAWMADETYNVYHAQGTVLPKLWEMQVNEVTIVKPATVSYSIGSITSADTVEALIKQYQSGFSVAYNDARCNFRIVEVELNELAFTSQNYSEIYYILQFYRFEETITLTEEVQDPSNFAPAYDRPYTFEEYGEDTYVRYDLGKNFIYDRVAGLCYPVDGLLDSYFSSNS